jgi:uncharacterized membrane protein
VAPPVPAGATDNTQSGQPEIGQPEIGQTNARLRQAHRQEASGLQHAVDRATAVIGWPGFVVLLGLAMLGWVVVNLVRRHPFDPPPFIGLATIMAGGALVVAALILTTQRREDKLADHRAQLVLELAIANDQKVAKIIELLEESRRDNPVMTNRIDNQADAMSTPSDATAVLEAIKELGEGTA